jgi:hypothetical protein
MPDEPAAPELPHDDAIAGRPEPADGVLQPRPTVTEMVVRRPPPAVVWRNRALALRRAVPQLARNPVVAGASAAAATVALRLAVDAVTRRALGTPAPGRPATLDVTGHVVHHVHVFHHVRVVHHIVHRPMDQISVHRIG